MGALGTDMNSLWPTDCEPRLASVRERWATIIEVDPDVVIDLHSAGEIYGEPGSGVG